MAYDGCFSHYGGSVSGACTAVSASAGLAQFQQAALQQQQAAYQQAQAQSRPSQEQIARAELLVKGKKVESKGIFASMKDGVAEFFHDNRTMISWLALIFFVDHFFFKGAFRDRLHLMVENMIGKIEEKIAK